MLLRMQNNFSLLTFLCEESFSEGRRSNLTNVLPLGLPNSPEIAIDPPPESDSVLLGRTLSTPLFNTFPLSVTAWKWLESRALTQLQRFAAIRNLLSRLGVRLDTLRRPVGMIEVCWRVDARSVELTGLVGRYALPDIRPALSAGRHLRLRMGAEGYLPVTHLLLRKDILLIYPLMYLLPPIRRRIDKGKARDTFLRVVAIW